jgi:hypothetical protein
VGGGGTDGTRDFGKEWRGGVITSNFKICPRAGQEDGGYQGRGREREWLDDVHSLGGDANGPGVRVLAVCERLFILNLVATERGGGGAADGFLWLESRGILRTPRTRERFEVFHGIDGFPWRDLGSSSS